MKRILLLALLLPLAAAFAAETGVRLDASPHDVRDLVSLQAGARTFDTSVGGAITATFAAGNVQVREQRHTRRRYWSRQ